MGCLFVLKFILRLKMFNLWGCIWSSNYLYYLWITLVRIKDKNLTVSDVRKYLASQLKPSLNSKIELKIIESLKTVIQDNGKDTFKIQISTKSKEYLDIYQLFIAYNMLYLFQGLDALENKLEKTFNIKIEAK